MRKICGPSLIFLALVLTMSSAQAQQPAKVWRIGVLVSSSPSLNAARDEAFRQGLRGIGYADGQNIVMDYRYAGGKLDRLPALAAELVQSKVDVIVVGGTQAAIAAKQATATIPIVVAGAGDLVEAGLVGSLLRPGGNVTGVSRLSPDFIGKRLSVLKQAIPKGTRVAVLINPDNPGNESSLRQIDLDAHVLGIRLQSLTARSPNEFEGAIKAAGNGRADALFVMADALFHSYPSQIVQSAAKNRLPAMYDRAEFVEAGGMMSYGTNLADLSRRAVWYVDKILKGSKPADLFLEEPIAFELMINLKTAKALGVMIPAELLTQANKVIK